MAGKGFSVFVNIGGRVASSFTSAINTVEGRLRALENRFKSAAAGARAAMKGIGESMKGLAAVAAAGGLSFGVKHALGSGAELAHEIQALKNAGRTAGEVAEAIAEANKTIGKLPTTTLSENLKVLNETTGAFGDWHHALENLDFNQRIGSMLKNAVGDKIGDSGEMFNSLVRAFEIRGTAADHHVYQKEVGELYKAMIFSRGNVNPHEFLNFAQQANPAIKNYSEEFLTKIAPSLIQEFGGERAGTRAGAWYNAIMGKTRDKRMADAWVKLGLLDEKNVLKNKKNGEIIGWNPGAMKGTDEAMANPLAWTEKYLVPALTKAGIDVNDQMSVTKELGKLFRNSEANRFANAITQVRDRKRLHKDQGLINAVPDAESAYWDTLRNDPRLAMTAVKASFENLSSALTLPLMKPAARALTAVAQAVNKIALVFANNPGLAKVVGGVLAALTGMAAIRLASFIFGLTGLGRALVFLALAAPIGLAARLVGIASAVRALVVASALGAVGRLRALAAGIIAFAAVGGSRAVLVALAGAFTTLGRAILLLPLTMLRGALVGLAALFSPIGIAVVAVTTALTALGVWVYNNLSGIGTFFTSFGDAFTKALGPEASANVSKVVGWLKQAWKWVSDLLGPIDESGKKWAAWGEAAGKGAAAVITALTGLPEKIGALAKQGYDALVNFNWSAAGTALVEKIAEGIKGGASALVGALTSAVKGAWDAALSKVGLGGSGASAPAPSVDGRRALGGSVLSGKTYLVGERGPELFRPGASGRIDTNGSLKRLMSAANENGETPTHRAIMRAEGTAGADPYNTVLGYGRYGTPSKPLTDMTLAEAYGFGRSVRARHGSSSAIGAFQIVGRTMKDAMRGTGLGWNDKFDPQNQRTMADWIRRNQGFGAWEGFKRHPGQLAAARAGTDLEMPTSSRAGASAAAPARRAGTVASSDGAGSGGHRGAEYGGGRGGAGGGGGGSHSSGLASRVASLATLPQAVARATQSASSSTTHAQRGPVSITVNVTSQGDAQETANAVRRELMLVFARMESDQRGLLSD